LNKYSLAFGVLIFALTFSGCVRSSSNGELPPPVNGTRENSRSIDLGNLKSPSSLEERFSYTYGYLLMETSMKNVQDINVDFFIRGVTDAGLNQVPLLPASERNSVLYEYQQHLMQEAAKRLETLARNNLEDAESFLAINGQRQEVETTLSGLQYEIITETEGSKPAARDTVKVNYRLTYLDGREGDASIRGIPSEFSLDYLIPGFREGLMLMTEGSKFRFFVHPRLGYGQEGSSRIEPNTLLIFDVELVKIIPFTD